MTNKWFLPFLFLFLLFNSTDIQMFLSSPFFVYTSSHLDLAPSKTCSLPKAKYEKVKMLSCFYLLSIYYGLGNDLGWRCIHWSNPKTNPVSGHFHYSSSILEETIRCYVVIMFTLSEGAGIFSMRQEAMKTGGVKIYQVHF